MKAVLYTCTFADYDQVFAPLRPTAGLDCVLFSDRPPRRLRGWQWRPLPEAAAGLSQTLANRYCKFFPHRLFPGAELSVYVDGNTLIVGDLTPLLAEFRASGAAIGLFAHWERSDLFAEFDYARQAGRIAPEDVERGLAQLAAYRAAGLAPGHPFTENGIVLRRHAAPGLDAAMTLWWDQLERYTRRDQISLPFVLHTTGLPAKIWDWNYKYRNPYFLRYPHRRGRARDLATYLRNGMLRSRAHYYGFGALLYGLRYLSGDFSPVRHWREAPER